MEQERRVEVVPADRDFSLTVPMAVDIYTNPLAMHVLSEEKVEVLASSSNPLPQNFSFATGGIAASLWIQLKAGVVDAASRHELWLAFFLMLILTLFFGSLAVWNYIQNRRVKQAIKRQTLRQASVRQATATPVPVESND
jgi:hypothetical protein